ncbi:hypothetical protein F5Y10DRAFT_17457 [Nemania abortiva]|nr:hypothetical protein F5Y10DRAFT_17457 [Nemania abortiva]
MCLLFDVMCAKTKSKSKSSTKKSSKKDCDDCKARRIAREEVNKMHMPHMPIPMMTKQDQFGFNPLLGYGYGYGYGDWATWQDNFPAAISNKQWKDHMKTAQDAYGSAQENGKKIGDMKNAITSEVKEAQKAIKEAHASVNSTDAHIHETRDAMDLAHATILGKVKEAHVAIQKTQDTINNKYTEHIGKQEECAADVARVRQILEEEAKKREDARRVQEMVQYAQSQGLLQMPMPQPQPQTPSSRSSSPTSSTSTSSTHEHGRRTRVGKEEEEREAGRLRWERKREQQQRLWLQDEQERWSRAEGELEFLRRRDAYFHPAPRFPGAYYDDVMEAPPYPYADFSPSGISGHRGGARGPRRVHHRCRAWDH